MPGEPAAEATAFRRELLFQLPSQSNLERDGAALIVHGVKLLAAGTWTDSMAKTPCSYSPDALREHAANWADSSLWSRHAGGQPRTITQKIGSIRNQHFEDDAVVGDLVLHGLPGTDSPGAIAMVEAGEADYFSAELTGTERWNVGRKLYEMQSITFLGGAVVNRGACSTCTLRHNEDGEEPGIPPAACTTDDLSAEPPNGAPADSDMELAELITKVTELEAANVDLTRQLGEAQTANATLKATVETFAETARSLEGLAARIEKIEKTPAPKTGGPAPAARELTAPPVLTIRNGEIYSEV